MFNIVIFGPPGSGKGTQSERIIEKYNLVHLSTGDVLRTEKSSGSELGNKIKELIDGGNLVPDEMVQEMVQAFVLKNKQANGFIFDGFPRTTNQAVWLDTMLSTIKEQVSLMLALEVDDEELKDRIMARGKISGRADDQNVSIVENRIAVYNQQTAPVMDFYKAQNKFYSINGVGSMDEIFNAICTTLDSIK